MIRPVTKFLFSHVSDLLMLVSVLHPEVDEISGDRRMIEGNYLDIRWCENKRQSNVWAC